MLMFFQMFFSLFSCNHIFQEIHLKLILNILLKSIHVAI